MDKPIRLQKKPDGSFAPVAPTTPTSRDSGVWVPFETLYAMIDFITADAPDHWRRDAERAAELCREALGRGSRTRGS
jgi:hypothetical protein